MRRIITFKVAGKDVHLPKLIGAFILFAALFMFIRSVAVMYDSWDNLNYVEECVGNVDISAPDNGLAEINLCRETLYKNTGVYFLLPDNIEGQNKVLTARQFWSILLEPIASVLFWLAILFIGWVLYRTGELAIPIEEVIQEIPEKVPKLKGQRKRK